MQLIKRAADLLREVDSPEAQRWFADYTEAIATAQEYLQARREYESDDIEIDPGCLTSRGDEGVWVQAWVFIRPEVARG